MLLDEDPAALIHECTSNFNIPPDRAALSRITDSLTALSQSRALRLTASRSQAHKLSRRLASLSQQHDLAVSASTVGKDHAERILALDKMRFKVAKEASDAEVEGERLEMECVGAEGVLGALEGEGGAGGVEVGEREEGDAKDVLKLKIYRSLGIDVEPDSAGRYTKALVRNTQKGRAEVVDMDPKVPRNLYADRFWQAL